MKVTSSIAIALALCALAGCKKDKPPKQTEVDLRPGDRRPVSGSDADAGAGPDEPVVPDAPKVLAKTTLAGVPAPMGAPVVDLEPLAIKVGDEAVGAFTTPPAGEGAFVWGDAIAEAVAKAAPGTSVVIAASADTSFTMLEVAAQGAATAARPELHLRVAGPGSDTTLLACAPIVGSCRGQALTAPGAGDFKLTLMPGHAASLAAFVSDKPGTMLGPLDAASLGKALQDLAAGSTAVVHLRAEAGVTTQDVVDALSIDGGARKLVFVLGAAAQ